MIIDKLDFPVFEKDDWSLMQEMEFIKGIEKWGVDNWHSLDEYLHNRNGIENLFDHFYSFYYNPFELTNAVENTRKKLILDEVTSPEVLRESELNVADSWILYKNPSAKPEIPGTYYNSVDRRNRYLMDSQKVEANSKKIEMIKTSMKEEFYTMWSVGRNDGAEQKQLKSKRPARAGK